MLEEGRGRLADSFVNGFVHTLWMALWVVLSMTMDVFLHGIVAATWITCAWLCGPTTLLQCYGLNSLKISALEFMFSIAQEKYNYVLICL